MINEAGQYSLDAVQNNPSYPNSLRGEINKLKEASPIAIKDITLQDISIDIKSADGAYFCKIENFFANNGIDINKVIAITLKEWANVSEIFDVWFNTNLKVLGFFSTAAQTINFISIRIAYLK